MTALASLMDARGLSAGDIAVRMGVTRRSVERWRTGEKRPAYEHLGPLADAIGVSALRVLRAVVADVAPSRR